jgi:hypothetical protein
LSFPERSDGNLRRLLHGDPVPIHSARQSEIPIAAARLGDDMGGRLRHGDAGPIHWAKQSKIPLDGFRRPGDDMGGRAPKIPITILET